MYQTNVIWEFIKILDPNCKFRILSDGYVLFESEKLNLGITQDNINTKQTNYTQQDLDTINKFIAMSKHKYEEVTR